MNIFFFTEYSSTIRWVHVAVGVMSVVIFLQLLIMTCLIISNKKNKNSYSPPPVETNVIHQYEQSVNVDTEKGKQNEPQQIHEISD